MRYERKYIITQYDTIQIKEWILSQSNNFKEHYHSRYINNIYYDTPNLTCYDQNIAEASHRIKYRVRWYGSYESFHKPKLELKIKKAHLNYKQIIVLSDHNINHYFDPAQQWKQSLDTTNLSQLEPILINQYKRYYFLSYSDNIRLTLDSQLSFSAPNHFQKIVSPDFNVVELKYGVDQTAMASSLIKDAPFRLSKLSKYVMGVQVLSGKGLI